MEIDFFHTVEKNFLHAEADISCLLNNIKTLL
jgi:hypothetical protein